MSYAYNKLNDFVLNVSKCEKILGMVVDDNFSCCHHMYACVKKAFNECNMILSNEYEIDNEY